MAVTGADDAVAEPAGADDACPDVAEEHEAIRAAETNRAAAKRIERKSGPPGDERPTGSRRAVSLAKESVNAVCVAVD